MMHCACCYPRILTATPSRFSKTSKSRISRSPRTSCGLFTIKRMVRTASSASKFPRDWLMTPREAQRLWKALNRPNLMVKIPSTVAGIQAVEVLIAEGINKPNLYRDRSVAC
jgi:Transaldolase/Fructose-6-phosphate aldolase